MLDPLLADLVWDSVLPGPGCLFPFGLGKLSAIMSSERLPAFLSLPSGHSYNLNVNMLDVALGSLILSSFLVIKNIFHLA